MAKYFVIYDYFSLSYSSIVLNPSGRLLSTECINSVALIPSASETCNIVVNCGFFKPLTSLLIIEVEIPYSAATLDGAIPFRYFFICNAIMACTVSIFSFWI